MALLFPCLLAAGCGGGDDRLAVHKVQGVVHRDGNPLADALVVFHPKDSSVGPISPRATTGADGRFQLTTYDSQDGAPAGSYAVTVTRFEPIVSGNSSEPGPNVLDQKIATKETTDIVVEVREGENQLEPIEVDR